MSALSRPRHPFVDQALSDAGRWCHGHLIDGKPALTHAVRVTRTIARHAPQASPDILAAALLHDAPDFIPEGFDLDADLTSRYNGEVPRIIRALAVEHHELDQPDPPVRVDDPPVLLVSTADKIVALMSLIQRAGATGDVTGFFAARPRLVRLLPHFEAFHQAATGRVPATLADALAAVLVVLARDIVAAVDAANAR